VFFAGLERCRSGPYRIIFPLPQIAYQERDPAACGCRTGGHPAHEMDRINQRQKMVGGDPDANTKDLRLLGDLVACGKMKAVIDRIYAMEQIVEAHRYVDTGQKKGNVVITFNR
jgi:NADPH:quinone reductase-like Zn-dependent oxidoreductase